jgi:hypothetical protein
MKRGTHSFLARHNAINKICDCILQLEENCGNLTELSKPRGSKMKHFIQFEAQVRQVLRPDYLRAKNALWTPGASLRFA